MMLEFFLLPYLALTLIRRKMAGQYFFYLHGYARFPFFCVWIIYFSYLLYLRREEKPF